MNPTTTIEIFDAHHERTKGQVRLIARIVTDGRKGRVEVFFPEYERLLNELFTMRHHAKKHAGGRAGGGYFVAVEGVLEPWTEGAISHVIEHELPARSLRAELVPT